jgi:protein SCO1
MKPLLLALVLAACGRHAAEPEPPGRPTAPPVAVPELEPEPSIYDLGIELTDMRDHRIALDAARGHPVVITMFYATCPVACPMLVAEIQQVLEALPAATARDVRVLLVSFDAARDTPARLSELARERGLDDRWIVAAAAEPDARALAGVLGVRYRKLDNGEFFHGATIVALDRDGRPIARTEKPGRREALTASLGR